MDFMDEKDMHESELNAAQPARRPKKNRLPETAERHLDLPQLRAHLRGHHAPAQMPRLRKAAGVVPGQGGKLLSTQKRGACI